MGKKLCGNNGLFFRCHLKKKKDIFMCRLKYKGRFFVTTVPFYLEKKKNERTRCGARKH